MAQRMAAAGLGPWRGYAAPSRQSGIRVCTSHPQVRGVNLRVYPCSPLMADGHAFPVIFDGTHRTPAMTK
jgi:hypothetical protein